MNDKAPIVALHCLYWVSALQKMPNADDAISVFHCFWSQEKSTFIQLCLFNFRVASFYNEIFAKGAENWNGIISVHQCKQCSATIGALTFNCKSCRTLMMPSQSSTVFGLKKNLLSSNPMCLLNFRVASFVIEYLPSPSTTFFGPKKNIFASIAVFFFKFSVASFMLENSFD